MGPINRFPRLLANQPLELTRLRDPRGWRGTAPSAGGRRGCRRGGDTWRLTVYCEVSASPHHYPVLTEAAENSGSLLLASISRLLGKKKKI